MKKVAKAEDLKRVWITYIDFDDTLDGRIHVFETSELAEQYFNDRYSNVRLVWNTYHFYCEVFEDDTFVDGKVYQTNFNRYNRRWFHN